MKKRKQNKEQQLSDIEFIRLNKMWNKFIVYKNQRDNLLCNILVGLINANIKKYD